MRMLDAYEDLPADPVIGLRPRLLAPDERRQAIPLLAALPGADGHEQIHNSITHWLSKHAVDAQHRGIMTLRDRNDVILALFFFALRTESALAHCLDVSRLRAAQAVGRHTVLGAALHTVAGIAERLDCREALVRAEEHSLAWLETAAALHDVGPAYGFMPRGADWVRDFSR
jgi:hypothetical protein